MTKLFEHAVDRAQRLSPEMQDEIARMVLIYAGDDGDTVELSPAEDAAIARSMAAAQRGDFATDDHVRAIWAKHGL